MNKPPSNDIVRVKTLMVGDEYELIVPRELAEMLEVDKQQGSSQPKTDGQRVVPTEIPRTKQPLSLQDMAASKGILAIENAIDAETCKRIIEHARQQDRRRSGLVNYDTKEEKHKESFVDDKVRDTYNISVHGIKETILRGLFYDAVTKYVEPFFKIRLDWWEEPQLLYYNKGGKYEPHVDADYWVQNPDGTAGWKRISDRDISILLYLNNEFEGGELNFPDHGFKIKPQPGLLIAFPSGKEFRHGAEPTLSGERFVLVSWASAEGVPKVQPQPPKYPVVWMKDVRKSA